MALGLYNPHRKINLYAFYGASFLLIGAMGASIMYLIVDLFPMSRGSGLNQVIVTLALIALGVGVPYGMMKFGFNRAHAADPHEKEVSLKELPKHQKDAQIRN